MHQSFFGLMDRLVSEARLRINNGELTERRLARVAGLSQPHVHNVLKGARVLSPEAADRILRALDLCVEDLVEECQCARCQERRRADYCRTPPTSR
jgi:predicted transcriptional regulator